MFTCNLLVSKQASSSWPKEQGIVVIQYEFDISPSSQMGMRASSRQLERYPLVKELSWVRITSCFCCSAAMALGGRGLLGWVNRK